MLVKTIRTDATDSSVLLQKAESTKTIKVAEGVDPKVAFANKSPTWCGLPQQANGKVEVRPKTSTTLCQRNRRKEGDSQVQIQILRIKLWMFHVDTSTIKRQGKQCDQS